MNGILLYRLPARSPVDGPSGKEFLLKIRGSTIYLVTGFSLIYKLCIFGVGITSVIGVVFILHNFHTFTDETP